MGDDGIVEEEWVLGSCACDIHVEEMVVHVELTRREEKHSVLLFRENLFRVRLDDLIIQHEHSLPRCMGISRVLRRRDRAVDLDFRT